MGMGIMVKYDFLFRLYFALTGTGLFLLGIGLFAKTFLKSYEALYKIPIWIGGATLVASFLPLLVAVWIWVFS